MTRIQHGNTALNMESNMELEGLGLLVMLHAGIGGSYTRTLSAR